MLRTCALCVLFACARPAVQAPRPQTVDQPTLTAAEIAERDAKQQAEVAQFFAAQPELVEEFVAWAKHTAVRDDFAGIDTVIGNARVISIGEADHNVHEYLAYRNRLAKY